MYSQDGMGLGHLRRSWNIAQEVLRVEPECDILVLADSPAASLFCRDRRIECMKLPTVIKTGDSTWRNGVLSGDVSEMLQLRGWLIREVLRGYRPDTILVDHMPVGALGELKPMLDERRRMSDPPRLFLGLRDIIDHGPVVRRVWEELGAYDYLPDYEAVLIYGCADIYDSVREYELGEAARDVVYCSYVSPEWGSIEADDDRPSREGSEEPFVLMMGGGGHDAFSIANAFVEAATALWRKLGLSSVLLTGPNMSVRDRRALVERAAGSPVRIEDGVEEATGWIREAAAIVSMAGYNSLCEIMAARKKALVVPRAGPSAEQRTRSRLFSERSLLRMLDPDHLSPQRMARALATLVTENGVPDTAGIPPLDGAKRSSRILLGVSTEELSTVTVQPLPARSFRPSSAPAQAAMAVSRKLREEAAVVDIRTE
jgi:predicted glycosyltransferase